MLLQQDDADAALRQATGEGHADRSSPTTATWASSAGMRDDRPLARIQAVSASQVARSLHRPDPRMVDPVQLVPGLLHVEGHGVLEDREAAVRGASAAWVDRYASRGVPRPPSPPASHPARPTGRRACRRSPAHRRSPDDRPAAADHLLGAQGGHAVEVSPRQSPMWASPMYGAAMASTRSPAKQMRSSGSQTTRSPLVWPRPRNRSSTTRLPRSISMRSSKVSVGRVSPGIDSALEQARHASPLTGPVLFSPLLDQVGRHAGRHDPRAPKALAPSTHGVVVGQHQIAERQRAQPRTTSIQRWAITGVARASMASMASVPITQPTLGSPCAV